jgi:hypothetical protein
MCDYSLQFVASRPAKVGDRLITTSFPNSATRGFASVEDRDVAVCLLPGTELAFEKEIRRDAGVFFRSARQFAHRVARFRQVNMGRPNVHRDALELPDGEIVLLTILCQGQHATVLQLPADLRASSEKSREEGALAV